MILGIDDPLFFFFSSSHTCRQVLYNFSSCAKSAWILTASQRNERMKNEEGTATGRWCQRLTVFPPAVSLLCLAPLLACHSSIHPSPPSPCTLFRSPIFRLLERHFYFMPNETLKCQAATAAEGASGEGGRGGHDETPCSLMHTCGLVLSPFYILDENMRKLSFACVYIENVLPHVVVSHTLSATPPPPTPPPPWKNELKSWLQKAAGNKALATRIICLSSASRK